MEPSQCPRVDEPLTASIACTRLVVAWSAWKEIAHVVLDDPSVAYGYNWQLSQDTLNGNDIENGFLVVKLVKHPRANGFQPSYQKLISTMTTIADTVH
jgi:hypothetical protein